MMQLANENIHKIAENSLKLPDIYESCIINQRQITSIEDILLPRALYFARALESLFKYDGKNSNVMQMNLMNLVN